MGLQKLSDLNGGKCSIANEDDENIDRDRWREKGDVLIGGKNEEQQKEGDEKIENEKKKK